MRRASVWVLMAGLILGGGARARGQMGFPGGPTAQMPPEMVEMQKARNRLMKAAAPEFYAFQTKLQAIEAKLGVISQSLAKKEIDKATAKENMLPLIIEEQEIRNDPEFLVEERLAKTYFSSPEYRKKEENVMRTFAENQKRKATP